MERLKVRWFPGDLRLLGVHAFDLSRLAGVDLEWTGTDTEVDSGDGDTVYQAANPKATKLTTNRNSQVLALHAISPPGKDTIGATTREEDHAWVCLFIKKALSPRAWSHTAYSRDCQEL
jgi:hypothetical protein